jgi:hypothetical protein
MLDIAGSGSQVARRLWVHHNYFHDFVSPGGNGAETIRWGLSGLSLSNGQGLCEYNLFVRCNGENEMISNKSSGNTYRYNTGLDSPGGEISQRHGDNCHYYGNYMKGTAGMRIYGDSHQIFSNYLEGNTKGIDMGNGDGDVHNGDRDLAGNGRTCHIAEVDTARHTERGGSARGGDPSEDHEQCRGCRDHGAKHEQCASSGSDHDGSWRAGNDAAVNSIGS